MSGPEFFQTPMGQQFYTSTMPRIAKALEQIVKHQERVEKSQAAAVILPTPLSDFAQHALEALEARAAERVSDLLAEASHGFIDRLADHAMTEEDHTLIVRIVRAVRED